MGADAVLNGLECVEAAPRSLGLLSCWGQAPNPDGSKCDAEWNGLGLPAGLWGLARWEMECDVPCAIRAYRLRASSGVSLRPGTHFWIVWDRPQVPWVSVSRML